MSKNMALRPKMSEKSYGLSTATRTYAFIVPMSANKLTVTDAVQDQFGVTVTGVRVAVIKGKQKRSYSKRRRPVTGNRATVKKAYVSLKEGDSINIFGEIEKEIKKAEDKETSTVTKKTTKVDSKPQRSIRNPFGRAPRQTQNRGGEK